MFWKKKSEPKPKEAAPQPQGAPAAEEKKAIPVPTKAEILKRLEELTPEKSEVFYLARSPKTGGPLGRGACIVELNPRYGAKGQKKYLLSVADVVGTSVDAKRDSWYSSDKAPELAGWIADRLTLA